MFSRRGAQGRALPYGFSKRGRDSSTPCATRRRRGRAARAASGKKAANGYTWETGEARPGTLVSFRSVGPGFACARIPAQVHPRSGGTALGMATRGRLLRSLRLRLRRASGGFCWSFGPAGLRTIRRRRFGGCRSRCRFLGGRRCRFRLASSAGNKHHGHDGQCKYNRGEFFHRFVSSCQTIVACESSI